MVLLSWLEPLRGVGSRRGASALFGAFIVCLACVATPCKAQSVASGEYQIKAAFLYKFLNFVEWPPPAFDSQNSPLVIGVLDAETLGDELSQVVGGRSVNGRSLVVQRLRSGDSLAGLHVLFVGRSGSARIPKLVAEANGRPLLIVGESEDAFVLGSAINFVVVDDKVRFDVSLRRAETVGLKISARLLAVARRVLASTS